MTKILTALRTPGAMMIALVLALFPQGEHTAQVFRHFSHDGGGNAAGLSYAFAAAVEVAVLLFVLAGHKRISYAFAGASFLTNIVYYAIGGVALLSVSVLPVLLLSALLPACIMGYSHTVASYPNRDDATGATETHAATQPRAWRWRFWRNNATPAVAPAVEPDTVRGTVQPSARDVALQMAGEGCSVAQIAAQVDAKPATVRSWIARHRAKQNGGSHE